MSELDMFTEDDILKLFNIYDNNTGKNSVGEPICLSDGTLTSNLLDKFIIKNYPFSTSTTMQFTKDKIDKFYELVKPFNLKKEELSLKNNRTTDIFLFNQNYLVHLQNQDNDFKNDKDNHLIYIYLYAKNIIHYFDFTNVISGFLNKYCVKEDFYIDLTNIYPSGNGTFSKSTEFISEDSFVYLDKNYIPYINIELFTKTFLKSDENILFLLGQPGTGKTKFVSMMLKEMLYLSTYKIFTIKDEEVLANTAFWKMLKDDDIDLVFLDDMDYLLSPREEEDKNSKYGELKSKFISQILSFSDGAFKNKTKFVVTTNKELKDVDSALLRPGRMFDCLEFRKLKIEEAKIIWENNELSIDLFENYVTEDINPAKLSSIIKELKYKDNNGNSNYRSYLSDTSVSVINTLNQDNKKIGF
jgi:hypothetical protein